MKRRIFHRTTCFIMAVFMIALNICAATPSDWAKDEVETAIEKGLVPSDLQDKYTRPITRAEFAKTVVQMCRVYYGVGGIDELLQVYGETHTLRDSTTFEDVDGAYSDDIDGAYRIGIINGRSSTKFDPDSTIKREEAAAMLHRAYLVCGGDEITVATPHTFSDHGDISVWAIADVQKMYSLQIIRGVENNGFAPKGQLTREQCYLMVLRLYNVVSEVSSQTDSSSTITTNYFIYQIYSDNTAEVKKYIGPRGIIVMQPEIDGYSVTGIDTGAFDGYSGMQVCVPDTVTDIADGAFPIDIGCVYYETEHSALRAYAESHGIQNAIWDWEQIAYIKWNYKPIGETTTGTLPQNNMEIAKAATTQIFCERSPEEDFDYTIKDGSVTVTGYHGDSLYVSIPDTVEGYPVREIGMGCFFDAVLKHVEIPGTVTKIASYVCGMRCFIDTVHVLDGEDCTIGYNVFCGKINHTRFHNNIIEIDKSERDSKYEKINGYIVISKGIVPDDFAEVNGFGLSIFMYPEE